SSIQVPSVLTPTQVSSPFDKFYWTLVQDYPDSMGGITVNADGSINILEVGTNSAFEQDAQHQFSALPAALHTSLPPSQVILKFVGVTNSAKRLYEVRENIASNLPSLLGGGIIGVGIDPNHNRVVVIGKATSPEEDSPSPTTAATTPAQEA